jgi:hypothetical protein
VRRPDVVVWSTTMIADGLTGCCCVYSMFVEVFRYLPLATIINSQVGRLPEPEPVACAVTYPHDCSQLGDRCLSCMGASLVSRACCWRR